MMFLRDTTQIYLVFSANTKLIIHYWNSFVMDFLHPSINI